MKKYCFIIIAALAVASCSNFGKKLTKDEAKEYGEIGYADIVSAIVQGYETRWKEGGPEGLGLSPVYSYCSPLAGFAMADINGDDVEELLIGDSFEDGTVALYDIFTINMKDGSLIHLAKGGERDRYSVAGGGIIVEEGSNSAEDSFRKGFRIKNGKLVEVNGWEETAMALEIEKFSKLVDAVCGGFTGQREISEEEMEMFRSVTGEGEMVFTPLSVSTQVVAGTNYRFYCRYEDTSKDAGDETRSGHCFVKIFKPLPGQGDPKLSDIETCE